METRHTTRSRSPLGLRALGWLAVTSMLAMALLGPSASPALGAFSGAIWTSLFDGATVNANHYAAKTDVYLNGGPQNCGNSGGLPDGDYYFQVTDPSGATLLSSDAIKFRQLQVVNGVIAGVSGDGNHAEGTGGCNGGLPVQLFPYDDTPNPGGEYSVDMAQAAEVEACDGFDADSTDFNFLDCAASKNDNFKVAEETPVLSPAIAIVKVADPLELPFGGGEVHYTYAVTNAGDAVLSNVTVVDDTCSPVTFVDGDSNDDGFLDLHETWNFECTTSITETTTNTAVASGFFGEDEVLAEDTATVTVLPPVITPPPVITDPPIITNPPSQSLLAATGTPVVTAPPTDAFGDPSRPSTDTWRLLLIALAGLLASLLVLTPATATRRR